MTDAEIIERVRAELRWAADREQTLRDELAAEQGNVTVLARSPSDDVWHQGGTGRRREAAWHLLSLMSEVSEDAWCATWMDGWHFELWDRGDDATADRADDGMEMKGYSGGHVCIPDGLCRRMRAMGELIDAWWWYRTAPRDASDYNARPYVEEEWGPRPVTIATWRRMHAIRQHVESHDLQRIRASRAFEARMCEERRKYGVRCHGCGEVYVSLWRAQDTRKAALSLGWTLGTKGDEDWNQCPTCAPGDHAIERMK